MTKARAIKIAYIGGGSRGWAHTLMNDLALCPDLTGEVALYDIDPAMAALNRRWGRRVNEWPVHRGEEERRASLLRRSRRFGCEGWMPALPGKTPCRKLGGRFDIRPAPY